MKIDLKQIAKRNYLLTFLPEEECEDMYSFTCLYFILQDKHIYFMDTHYGPKYIQQAKSFITNAFKQDFKYTVFNSHSHHDHVWGNSCFSDSIIISHEMCLNNLVNHGNLFIELFEDQQAGNVSLTLPNKTFQEKLSYDDNNIIFFHSPGHTFDSASCYDCKTKVLYVGDNIERGIPLLDSTDILSYIKTIDYYKSLKPVNIVSAHDLLISSEELDYNLRYLKSFKTKEVFIPTDELHEKHMVNEKIFLFNQYQEKAKLNKDFILKEYLTFTFPLMSLDFKEIKAELVKKYGRL